MTSGHTMTTLEVGKNDQDERYESRSRPHPGKRKTNRAYSHIKTIRSIGRKLTFRK